MGRVSALEWAHVALRLWWAWVPALVVAAHQNYPRKASKTATASLPSRSKTAKSASLVASGASSVFIANIAKSSASRSVMGHIFPLGSDI